MRIFRVISMFAHFKLLAVAAFLVTNASAQETAPPGSASHPIEATPMPLTEEEALPPVGKGNMFSDEQLRYCLAQLVRVDAVRPLLDRYEHEEVEHFNALVADFNARCGSYRYKGNALDEAKAWLEENRVKIDAAARETYTKRFPHQSKVAKSPKKATVAAPQAGGEPLVTARATAESKPGQSSKPVPAPEAATGASEPSSSKPKGSASDATKPIAAPPPHAATEDKPAQPSSKPAPAPETTATITDASRSKPQASASDASKPASAPTPPPPAVRDEKPSPTATKPASPSTSKPKEVAAEPSTKPSASSVPVTPSQAPRVAADAETSAAPAVRAAPVEPLISKPKEFPSAARDASVASTPPAQAPDTSAPVPAPATAGSQVPPGVDDKAAKGKPPAGVAATAQAEPSTKPQAEDREAASRNSGPRKAGKPASKPPRPLPSARKTEPPAQVAAVAPKPETPTGPEVALARLTSEIQRVGSQVLTQPAGASESNTDLTTQVEVRYAEGGWVRSIVVGESSGSPALDEQALALARATRLPDVPEELRSREFSVRFPVVFRAAR
jgi:TonB family protein